MLFIYLFIYLFLIFSFFFFLKVPLFLTTMEGDQEAAMEIEGIKGCAFCSGLGHRIGQCEKLQALNRTKIAGSTSRSGEDGGY